MYFGLAFAFTVIGLTAGYMVAASDTPVVSAALPVLAGLATAAIAVVAGRADLDRITDYIKDVTKEGKSRDVASEVSALTRLGRVAEDHTRTTVRALGLLTALFAVGFAGGLGTGTWVRVGGHVNAWAHPVAGPWTVEGSTVEGSAVEGSTPARAMVPSFEGALFWLGLERQLKRAGVLESTITDLYDQYVNEYTEAVNEIDLIPPGTPASSARESAHRMVVGMTSSSVIPIGSGEVPGPLPALYAEALEALFEDVGALRREAEGWFGQATDLTTGVDRVNEALEALPPTSHLDRRFDELQTRLEAPQCWTYEFRPPIENLHPAFPGTLIVPGAPIVPPIVLDGVYPNRQVPGPNVASPFGAAEGIEVPRSNGVVWAGVEFGRSAPCAP